MAARLGHSQRALNQRRTEAEAAAAIVHRQRAQHQRGDAPGADVPQPHSSDQPSLRYGRQAKAFGGRASVAQALAGARMAVVAKAGIEQRLARSDVRGPLAADRERSGVRCEGNRGLPQSSHGTSVPARNGRLPRKALSRKSANEGEGAGAPAPVIQASNEAVQMWEV